MNFIEIIHFGTLHFGDILRNPCFLVERMSAYFRLISAYIFNREMSFQYFITRNSITKTCLYNFDPLKPHFYIGKLGFTGVEIIFLISAQNIDCGYSLELPRRGFSNEYP